MFGFRIIIAVILPALMAGFFRVLEIKGVFEDRPSWVRQIAVGIGFGLLTCFATRFGIPYDDYLLNVRSAAPMTAGLLFGGPAGVIAALIGALYRWMASAVWGFPTYTLAAGMIATMLAGFIAGICRKFMFENKKIYWYYGVYISLVTEVFHMLLVFITHMNDISTAFEIVRHTALIMITANCIAVFLSIMVVTLISKEKMQDEKAARPMIEIFAISIFASVLVVFLFTGGFTYYLHNNIAEYEVKDLLSTSVSDVEADVKGSLDRDLLGRTNSVADALKDHGYTVTDGNREEMRAYLQELQEDYNLSEIYIVGRDGIVDLSSNEMYDGFNMIAEPDSQSAEFMCLFRGISSLVQEYQPMAYDNKVWRKFAGVSLSGLAFVQTSYDKKRFESSMKEELRYEATNRHIGQTGFVFILDPSAKNPLISAPKNTFLEDDLDILVEVISQQDDDKVMTFTSSEGTDYYCLKNTVEGYIVAGCIPVSEATFSRAMSVYINLFMQLILFFVIFLLLFILLRRIIIRNINRINHSLDKITQGYLDTKVDVDENEELTSLSKGINTTVDRLKEYIDEAEKRIEKELALAKSIQHSALPSVFPPFPHRNELDLYASMTTAKEVGGDFYDYYFLGRNHLLFLVADVSGKGIPAAMFMMTSKTIIKSLAESGLDIAEVCTRTNEKLCESNEAGMFVTSWMGIINLETGLVKYANAGHNPPVIRHGDGSFEYLKSRPNLVLAGMEGINYRENELQLMPGDEIFLYTDGVTEATDRDNQLFGEERLLEVLDANASLDAEGLCGSVMNAINDFVGDAAQFDDITMVSLKLCRLAEEEREVKAVKELFLDATIENIETVTDFVDAELEALDCPPKAMVQINIAIDELFGNIAHYAYNPETGGATVKIEVEENPMAVVITFIDNGKPFDPLSTDEPDITASAEDRAIGGLGIFMVKNTMDALDYEYKDGQNILRIKKNL